MLSKNTKAAGKKENMPDEVTTGKSDDFSNDIQTNKSVADKIRDNENIQKKNTDMTDDREMTSDTVGKLKEDISEKLEITVEELENIMSQLGLCITDLFDTNNLAKIIVEVRGLSGAEQIIADSDAYDLFKSLVQDVADARQKLEQNGINIVDEHFADQWISEDIQSKTDSVVSDEEINMQQLSAEEIKTDADDKQLAVIENVSQKDVDYQAEDELKEEKAEDVYKEAVTVHSEDDVTAGEEATQSENGNKQSHSGNNRNHTESSVNNTPGIQVEAFANHIDNIQEILTDRVGRTDAYHIIEQITEQIKITVAEKFDSIEMQLYPEHLGKVGIQVVSREGILTAQITAENEAVKRVIETQIATLKENFNNQGYKVENVEVTIASHSFEENGMNQNNESDNQKNGRKSRKIDKATLDEINGISTDDEKEREMMSTRGSTVSYMA